MNDIKLPILASAVLHTIVFILGMLVSAYVKWNWSIDPSNWSVEARLGSALWLAVIVSSFVASIAVIIEELDLDHPR